MRNEMNVPLAAYANTCTVLECEMDDDTHEAHEPYSFNVVLRAVGRWVSSAEFTQMVLDDALKQRIKTYLGDDKGIIQSATFEALKKANFKPHIAVTKKLMNATPNNTQELYKALAVLEEFDPMFSTNILFDEPDVRNQESDTTDTVVRMEGLAAAKEPAGFVPKVIECGRKDASLLKWEEFCQSVALTLFNLRVETGFSAIGLEAVGDLVDDNACTFDSSAQAPLHEWDRSLTEMFRALVVKYSGLSGKMTEIFMDEKCDKTHAVFGNWLDWIGASDKLDAVLKT